MAIDLSKLQADQAKAIEVLQSLPAIKAQIADLQAKLAAVPHEDPSVQATVDQMAAALETALPTDAAPAPVVTDPATAAPYPGWGYLNTVICRHPAVKRSGQALSPAASNSGTTRRR